MDSVGEGEGGKIWQEHFEILQKGLLCFAVLNLQLSWTELNWTELKFASPLLFRHCNPLTKLCFIVYHQCIYHLGLFSPSFSSEKSKPTNKNWLI